jgi:glucose/arabinose dehydrogenase
MKKIVLSVCVLGVGALGAFLPAVRSSWARPNPKGPALFPQQIRFQNGRSFALNLPRDTKISLAAQGLKRPRFMALSPDGRLFITDMYDKSDNTKGKIYVLENFDAKTRRFKSTRTYLSNLHNPNNVAFDTDASGKMWLYTALTDKLVRYPYRKGDVKPSGAPQVLAKYPAYGLGYKYGGWHLTRTVAVAPNHRLYVSVGSSCNACLEKEPVRATIASYNGDGSNAKTAACGLRNAVGLKFVEGKLWATNMGADHLGDNVPNDTLIQVKEGGNYGWPTVYVDGGKAKSDPKFKIAKARVNPAQVPPVQAYFFAHSSPLGLEYFDRQSPFPLLRGQFLVSLHGAGFTRINHGYSVCIAPRNEAPGAPRLVERDFITGFKKGRRIYGRPADILRFREGFLLSDDYAGAVYYVTPSATR